MWPTDQRALQLVQVTAGGRRSPVVRFAGQWPAALWWAVAVALAWLLVLSGAVRGGVIYVDSRVGDDRYDGRSQEPTGTLTGPVQSLEVAVARSRSGDSIVLADNGHPYYASVTLFGDRNSGASGQPVTIEGNGATLSGARPIAAGSWQHVEGDVWRVTPVGKTYYQLILDGKAAPEVAAERSAAALPALSEGTWCAWRGAVYYRAAGGVDPNTLSLSLADADVGITLLDVQHVVIRNVTLQHYRLDGINAHDRCRDIELVNVTLQANGRAGLAVGGTSRVHVRDSKLQQNRVASALITELGEAELQGSEYDVAPTVAK